MAKVKIQELSIEGHYEFNLDLSEAVQFLRNKIDEENKWVYVDGDFVNSDMITEAILVDANHILCTAPLAGGSSLNKIDTFKVHTTVTDEIDGTFSISLNSYTSNIEIVLSKQSLKYLQKSNIEITNTLRQVLTQLGEEFRVANLKQGPLSAKLYPYEVKIEYADIDDSDANYDSYQDLVVSIDPFENVFKIQLSHNPPLLLIHYRNFICNVMSSKLDELRSHETKTYNELLNL